MRSLKWWGLALWVVVFVSPRVSAKLCPVQEEPRDRALIGMSPSGGTSIEKVWLARYPLQPAGSISVENVQGDITVEAWDRAEVEVAVVKRALGPAANLDDVRIDVEADGRRLTLRTIYPKQSAEPVRVDFRLRVPRQVRLDHLRTVNGSIKVRNIEGAVDVRTLNGNIENINVTGSVLARAINGNIAVSIRTLPEGSAPVQMETVNGHLFLALPADANADLQLRTVAGRVTSNYVFTISETPGDTSWRTRLGHGGTQIRLRTVRGNIRVAQYEELL